MNSREKGKRGERAAAHQLRKHGYDARRGQQFSGANGDADVVGLPGYHIEVKYTSSGHGKLYEWVEQARRDSRDGEKPFVMHKKVSKNDRGLPWLVTMDFEDFIELVEKVRQ